MRCRSRILINGAGWAMGVALSLCGAAALASGGYYSGVKGGRALGRGGAFTAKADDLSAVFHNPAGLSRLEGWQVQVGNCFSWNMQRFEREPTLDFGNEQDGAPPYVSFAEVDNQTPWQWLEPLLGVSYKPPGLQAWTFALASYAPPGVSELSFPIEGGQRYMMVHREAVILHHTLNVAWQPSAQFGVGASLVWIHAPRIVYQLVVDASVFPQEVHPVSSDLDVLSTVSGGDAFTPGAVLGAWYRPLPFWELGLSGQIIPSRIKTKSRLSLRPLGDEVGEIVLERNGRPANDVSLTLPLPVSAHWGVRYLHLVQGEELFDVELDFGYENWSRTERFTVDGNGLNADLRGQDVDLGSITIDKRWRDTLSVRLGGDLRLMPDALTVRAGVFYESALAPSAYSHIDFVSGKELGAALGASVFLGDVELVLGYNYRVQPSFRVSQAQARVAQQVPGSACEAPYTDPNLCHPQYLGRGAPPVNAGRYQAGAHQLAVDGVWRF